MKIRNQITILACLLTFTLSGIAQPLAPAIRDAVDNGDGSYTNWFGTFTPEADALTDEGWINHTEHGRLYVDATGQNLWIYDPNVAALGEPFSGWIYTNRNYFPYFYVRNNPTTFLLYVSGVSGPEGTPRVFIDTKTFDTVFLSRATTDTIVDIAVGLDAFSSLEAAVITAGLAETLSGPGPFTVFAPTNDAFGKLDPDVLNDLLTNEESKETLGGILTYHVVPGRVTSGMLGLDLGNILSGEVISGYVETVNGADLRVDVTPFGILLNGTTMVTGPDVEAANGIIHIIDSVLLPPANIYQTAKNAALDTLVAAVDAAGLMETLEGPGPYTVFAPTEAAFGEIPAADLTALLGDSETLSDILLYHVTPGKVYASEVMPMEIPMANGDMATVSIDEDGNLMINGATIVATDIVASNGVIHVIDAVILPPSE